MPVSQRGMVIAALLAYLVMGTAVSYRVYGIHLSRCGAEQALPWMVHGAAAVSWPVLLAIAVFKPINCIGD